MKNKMTKIEKKFITDMAFKLNNYYKNCLSKNIKRGLLKKQERIVINNPKLACKQL